MWSTSIPIAWAHWAWVHRQGRSPCTAKMFPGQQETCSGRPKKSRRLQRFLCPRQLPARRTAPPSSSTRSTCKGKLVSNSRGRSTSRPKNDPLNTVASSIEERAPVTFSIAHGSPEARNISRVSSMRSGSCGTPLIRAVERALHGGEAPTPTALSLRVRRFRSTPEVASPREQEPSPKRRS